MSADDMVAGRELDALVAEKVMGWNPCANQDNPGWIYFDSGEGGGKIAPAYSTNIAAAWEVVEKLGGLSELSGERDEWFCAFWGHTATAKTAPLAICLAALQAVGGGPPGEP